MLLIARVYSVIILAAQKGDSMEPMIRREGNVRLVCQAIDAWPYAYQEAIAPIDQALAEGDESIAGYGPVQVLVSLPPDDPDLSTWQLQIARACRGIPALRNPLLVEDYHQLVTCTVQHQGPVRDLARSYRLAADFARSQGAKIRPYWRISLCQEQTADGQGILLTDVSVFIDR